MRIADTSAQDVVLTSRGTRGRWMVAAGVAIVLIAVAIWIAPLIQRWAGATLTIPLERLRVATVARDTLVRDVSAQGQVVAATSPTLFAPAAGSITLVTEAGAQVTAGQVLAVLDSPELSSRLEQEDSGLRRLDIELQRQRIESRQKELDNRRVVDLASVTLEAAQREKRRADAAFEISSISAIDFEKARDDLRNAQLAHQHAVANAGLDSERLAFELQTRELEVERQRLLVADLRRQVQELELRSPVDGMVGNLLVEQKSAVARNQPVMAVVDLSRFEIETRIPESYADDLGLGMAAEILINNQRWPATLVAISPEIVQNQVTARLRFTDATIPGLRQNQRLTARILMEEKANVLTLQRGQFLDTGGGRLAYVLGDDMLARRRPIEVGARSLSAVEITAGLQAGERVIISSIDQFRGADTVLITQ